MHGAIDDERACSPSDSSDFEDTFLKEVAEEPPFLLPTPDVGERMGGRDGRRFEILGKLGGGAMGLVFRARDEELQRIVALKFLVPHGGLGEGPLISLLRQEARMVAQLDHENIVRIFDVSEWSPSRAPGKVPFLVMECLEGESLSSLIRRERLRLPRALELMCAMAAGLAHAHERHVIHRDLKPSNVFILSKGKVKLLDFGLAHLVARSPSLPSLPAAGTPTHMAPEQWRGDAQDERTDVWALGITFFELLTGLHPYPDASPLELRALMRSPDPMPSVRERCPELPEDIDRFVATALAKEPAKRFSSAVELREALRGITRRLAPWREPAQPVPPQRRQVTLVACWLADLSNLSEHLDPEDSGELEAEFHRSCAKVIRQCGGSIATCVGDEVLACFGYPLAREDDSERAVRAGLRLSDAMAKELSRDAGRELAVKVGIHTDLVVVEDISPELHGPMPSLQGAAPKVATWLARQAPVNAVILSEATHKLVRGAFATEPLGARTFQGLSGRLSVGVHRLLHEEKAECRFDRALFGGRLTPLVGRERELRQLLDLWEQARDWRGAFALISGEAGIGKSRLLQEMRERLDAEAMTCARCQCWSQFSNSAFYPVTEMVQRQLKLDPETPLQERMMEAEDRLRELGLTPEHVHLIVSLLSIPGDEDTSAALQLTPERRKEKTFAAVAALIRRVAAQRPLLLVIEDLHWADPSTLQLLAFLLDQVPSARILVLLTTRPELHLSWPSKPWFHRLTLDRLSPELTAVLVREAAHGTALSDDTVQQLVAKTDGVPLFVEEMTRMVVEQDSTRGPPIPVTLHELLLARLDLLPPRRKALAQLSSVVGRSFTHSLLSQLSGRENGALRQDLDGLIEAGLLQRQEDGSEPRYQFRHALIQDAAYQALPRSARRHHHRRVALTLAEQFPDTAESQPELLAHHYTESGENEKAIPCWARAGERASQRSAHVEAVSHLSQALGLLRALPETPQRDRQELRLLVDLGIPLMEARGFGSPEVEQTYARAWTLMQEVGDALPSLELSHWGPFAYYFARGAFPRAQELAELLLAVGNRRQNAELLALGHRMMATVLFTLGEMNAAMEHVGPAIIGLSFDIGQHRAIALKHWVDPTVAALSYASVVHSVRGDPGKARRDAQAAIDLATQIAHPHTSAFALTYTALSCQVRGEPECVMEWTAKGIALSSEHKFRLWLGWSTLLRSWAIAQLGQPTEGLAIMRVGLDRWVRSGIRAGMPHFLGMRAEMQLKLGAIHEAMGSVEEALAWVEETDERSFESELHRIKGDILRMLGREDEAREHLLWAFRVAHHQGAGNFAQRAARSLAAADAARAPWKEQAHAAK